MVATILRVFIFHPIKKATRAYSFLPNIDLRTHRITDNPTTVPQLMFIAKSNPAESANQFQICSKHHDKKKLIDRATTINMANIAKD